MKLIYKPFGILLGVVGGLLSRRVFRGVWSRVDEHEPPTATTEAASWPKVLGASALQALTFALTRTVVDRFGAQTFRHLTGFWPGEKRTKPSE